MGRLPTFTDEELIAAIENSPTLTEAAKRMGKSQAALLHRMKKLGIASPFSKPEPTWTIEEGHQKIQETGGNYSEAARRLGVPPGAFYSRMADHGFHSSLPPVVSGAFSQGGRGKTAAPGISDLEVREAFHKCEGNARATARLLGVTWFGFSKKLQKLGLVPSGKSGYQKEGELSPDLATTAWSKAVKRLTIEDGIVLVGSDMHYWPGQPRTTAHAAMVRLAHELNPTAIIANGDVMDLPQVSVHPAIGWEDRPDVADEIVVAQARLAEFEDGDAELFWTAGNHDLRYETYLAKVAPQYANITGMHLHDHFPSWTPAWLVEINEAVMVKHRWHGGVHATYNNTLKAGRSIVTGHLHAANVTAYTDYNGTRYGVDSGTLAVPYAPQFIDYTEANPVNWRSSCAVLTFYNGRLLMPELCVVFDETQRLTMFRGRVQEEAI